MPGGGSKPGQRRGGRAPGTPNKLPKGERALVKLDEAEAQVRALKSERLLGDRDAEFLEDPLRQIDQPPAHHAMARRDRAALDHAGDGPPLKVIELARLTRRLAVQESVRPASVEAQHPVPDDLKPDAADL